MHSPGKRENRHNTNHCKSNFIPLQVVGMSLSTVGSWRWCGVNVYGGPKEQYWTTGHEAIWPVLNVPLNCDTFRGISYSRIHRRRHKGIVVTQGIRTNKSHFLLARNETQSYEFNREIWTPRRPINPSSYTDLRATRRIRGQGHKTIPVNGFILAFKCSLGMDVFFVVNVLPW